MLKLAKIYEQQLVEKFSNTYFNERYKYYFASNYFNYKLEFDNDSWGKIEMASIDRDDNILGFLSARIDRPSDMVSSLLIMNFGDINYTFSKDFHTFISELLTVHNFRKISFSVVIGNPAEEMYDKYITRYGGRIVGTFKEEVRLYDGKYYDHKHYEIFKSDFESKLRGEK